MPYHWATSLAVWMLLRGITRVQSNKRVETLRGAGTTEHLYNVVLLSRDRLKVTWLLCNHALLTDKDWAIQPKYLRTNILRFQSSTSLNLCQRRVKWTFEGWGRDDLTKSSYNTELVICSLTNQRNVWLELVVEIKYMELWNYEKKILKTRTDVPGTPPSIIHWCLLWSAIKPLVLTKNTCMSSCLKHTLLFYFS